MAHRVSFQPTPNGPIVVVHAEPPLMTDAIEAGRVRRHLARILGEVPVLLRCRLGEHVSLIGPEHLRRWGLGPEVDVLPVIEIDEVGDVRRIVP